MATANKTALATVIAAIFLVSPIGACPEWLSPPSQPADHCGSTQPAPAEVDCAMPGCIFIDTHVVPGVIAALDEAGFVTGSPVSATPVDNQPAGATTGAFPVVSLTRSHRLALFHQFLI